MGTPYQVKKYHNVSATLVATVTDEEISLGTLSEVVYGYIFNEDFENEFIVKINDVSNDEITIKGRERYNFSNMAIFSLYFTNNNVEPINYRMQLWGS